jgi:hypothetical protein
LIARLKEIERKCDSMGTRNEEFPMMKDKLTSIIARLEAGEQSSGDPLPYRALGRELFPIAHLFESVGFMSVGKEIAHVERALTELEPEPVAPIEPVKPVQTAPATVDAKAPEQAPSIEDTTGDEGGLAEIERKKVPKPVLAWLFILIVAIAMAAALILKTRPFKPKEDPTRAQPTGAAVSSPTPVTPSPTLPPRDLVATPSAKELFSEALLQARLALRNGDVDEATKYLSIAALTDRQGTSVVEVANGVLDQLLQNAHAAAADGKWEEAATLIAQARVVASRFDLSTLRINAAEQEFAEMERYRMVEPEETEILRAAIGERVEVMLDDGSMLVGQIVGVAGQDLVLEVEDDVGGGIVSFTDEVPLATIRWIRIWKD